MLLESPDFSKNISNVELSQNGQLFLTYISETSHQVQDLLQLNFSGPSISQPSFVPHTYFITQIQKNHFKRPYEKPTINIDINLIHIPIWLIDKDLNFLKANDYFAKLLWYDTGKEIIGKNVYDFMDEEGKASVATQASAIETTQHRMYKIHLRKKDGSYLPVSINSNSIFSDSGEFLHAISFIYDDSELVEQTQKALTDSLTGLKNRRAFDDALDNHITSLKQQEGKIEVLNLGIIDIDYFKQINDKLWHPVWDKVLTEFWQICKKFESENLKIYRIGWEEFWAIGLNMKKDDFIEIINNIRMYCETNHSQHITLSAGTSYCTSNKECDANYICGALYNEADTRLWFAKRSGRNRVCDRV